jgi:hypothetical protein
VTSAAVAAAMFGLGAWSFAVIRQSPFRGVVHVQPPGVAQQAAYSSQPAALVHDQHMPGPHGPAPARLAARAGARRGPSA